MEHPDQVTFLKDSHHPPDSERCSLISISPKGTTIRPPPKPHDLDTDITPDTHLFHTMHMGAAIVDPSTWHLVVTGLVSHPFTISLPQLRSLPATTITTFHECYGSPLTPPTTPLWRIGNVTWTGCPLSTLLSLAQPLPTARFIWSEGLDSGTYAHVTADRYQKDLPIEKAVRSEVLLAYAMNGEPLTKERGFPVRLVVPGWFGTNSTKWVCRLEVREGRAPGPWTTVLYNEADPEDETGRKTRPVWKVEVNSMICRPEPGQTVSRGEGLRVWGRAWGGEEVEDVQVCVDGGKEWVAANVSLRREFEWQRWEVVLVIPMPAEKGRCKIMARATDREGKSQPLTGRRNCVHSVEVVVT